MTRLDRRRAGWVLAGCAAVAVAALAWGLVGAARAPAPPPHPVLALDRTEVSLGTVLPGATAAVEVGLRNAGGAPLEIRNLKTSCGCAPASIDRTVLGPGEGARVTVRFQAPPYPGQVSHRVLFECNDPDVPATSVGLTALVRWPVEASPVAIRVPGIPLGTASERELEVYAPGDAPLAVAAARSSVPWIEVRRTDASARRVRYAVTIRPAALGRFQESVVVETGCPDRPSVIVPVEGEATGAVRVSPQSLILGRVPAATATEIQLLLSAAAAPPAVARVEIAGDGWAVESWRVRPAEAARARLTVVVKPPAAAGHSRATVRVVVDGDPEPLEVPVSCVAVATGS